MLSLVVAAGIFSDAVSIQRCIRRAIYDTAQIEILRYTAVAASAAVAATLEAAMIDVCRQIFTTAAVGQAAAGVHGAQRSSMCVSWLLQFYTTESRNAAGGQLFIIDLLVRTTMYYDALGARYLSRC